MSGLGGSGRGRPPNSDQYRDAFDWVRYALIAMLIVSPVARGIFVWFAAGGRVQLRRDMFGNVVGLVVIRPINLHDPHSWPPAEEWTTGASSRMRIQKLTVEQVRSLPEIQYGHPSGEGDGGDRGAPLSDSVAEGTGAPQTATPVGPTVTGEDATGEDDMITVEDLGPMLGDANSDLFKDELPSRRDVDHREVHSQMSREEGVEVLVDAEAAAFMVEAVGDDLL